MKTGIHPKYDTCKVTCACGNEFETRATVDALRIDICGACHPFYTGKQKFVDTAGRVQKFRERYGDFRARRKGEHGAQYVEPTEPSESPEPAPETAESDG